MSINFQLLDVPDKWRHYRKWINPIQQETFNILNSDKSLNSFSVILIDSLQMKSINKEYRQIDRATDVLSFVDDEDDYLGDIFVNVDFVEKQAQEYGHSKKREFCFLVTHGLLHLLGYDHQDETQEKEMFEYQERILKNIAPLKKQIR